MYANYNRQWPREAGRRRAFRGQRKGRRWALGEEGAACCCSGVGGEGGWRYEEQVCVCGDGGWKGGWKGYCDDKNNTYIYINTHTLSFSL
jgi:hypothetical protein